MTRDADREVVEIDADLHARVADRVVDSEFDSVDEYVAFTLEELLVQLEGTADDATEQDEEVRDRLRELGYLE